MSHAGNKGMGIRLSLSIHLSSFEGDPGLAFPAEICVALAMIQLDLSFLLNGFAMVAPTQIGLTCFGIL